MALARRTDRFTLRDDSATLLSAAGAATPGTWMPIHGVFPLTVTIEGTFVATVKVFLSDAIVKPADADSAKPQLGGDFDAPDRVQIDGPYRWVKVAVTAFTSGSISAFAYAG